MGADYLELDLQLTRDNVLVVFHDEDLKPKTNVEEKFPSRKDCQISDFTWDELQQLDIGSWFHDKFPDRAPRLFKKGGHPLRMLKLEDVIEIAQGGTHTPGLYIELKYPVGPHPHDRLGCGNLPPRPAGSFERILIESLEKTGWIKSAGNNSETKFARVIFESFNPESLERLKAIAPHVPRILLVDEMMVRDHGWDTLIEWARHLGVGIGPWGSSWASGLDWSREHAPRPYRAIRADLVLIDKFHRAGLIVHAWTIDDEWEMDEVLESGADGFFTDRPMQALAIVGKQNSRDIEELWKKMGY
jgi:glycerophosphoryl diester phosphodiesterase